jgi:predicted RNA-binding protein with PIN domain
LNFFWRECRISESEQRPTYLLDGYNILFTLTESDRPLAEQRQKVIRFLQKRFASFKMNGILIFDGRIRRGEESGRSYPSPLEVIYTSEGESADALINELLEISKNPGLITVITNDRGIITRTRLLGGKTMGTEAFIQWLLTRNKSREGSKSEMVDTKQDINRLLVIFEKRLKDWESDHKP